MLIDVANKVPGFTNRSIKMSCINANVYKFHFGSTLTNGQTYTVSFWAKAQVAGGYQNFMLGEGMWGSGGGDGDCGGWRRDMRTSYVARSARWCDGVGVMMLW